jgi:hypothetical protein
VSAARGLWDASKHPRGAGGKFGVGSAPRKVTVLGGPMSKRKQQDLVAPGVAKARLGYDFAVQRNAVFSPSKPRAVTKWEPGMFGGKDARIEYRYSRAVGFKQSGHQVMPAGYVKDTIRRRHQRPSFIRAAEKDARRRRILGLR